MAKKFAELKARMTPEAHADAEQIFQQHVKEMPLHELRKAQQSEPGKPGKGIEYQPGSGFEDGASY